MSAQRCARDTTQLLHVEPFAEMLCRIGHVLVRLQEFGHTAEKNRAHLIQVFHQRLLDVPFADGRRKRRNCIFNEAGQIDHTTAKKCMRMFRLASAYRALAFLPKPMNAICEHATEFLRLMEAFRARKCGSEALQVGHPVLLVWCLIATRCRAQCFEGGLQCADEAEFRVKTMLAHRQLQEAHDHGVYRIDRGFCELTPEVGRGISTRMLVPAGAGTAEPARLWLRDVRSAQGQTAETLQPIVVRARSLDPSRSDAPPLRRTT